MKNKAKWIILSVVGVLLLAVGGTLAYYGWISEEETRVNFDVCTPHIVFTNDNTDDVESIIPVMDKEDGIVREMSISVDKQCVNATTSPRPVTMSIKLKLKKFTSGLKDPTFKYEFYKEDELITDGDFVDYNQGDTIILDEGETVDLEPKTYKLYVYLDGNEDNPTTTINQQIKFNLYAEGENAVYYDSLANMIIKLSRGDTWADGASGVYATNSYTEDEETLYHDYRYIGAEVNNYVRFNDDLYRIIGVFDDYTHGIEGEYLVKLISADLLTANSWGVYNNPTDLSAYYSYKQDWTGNSTGAKANANVLLNDYFYNHSSTSDTYGACSNWTYYSISTDYRTNDCTDIVGWGIKDEYRNYIESDAKWWLYGYSSNSLSKQNFYSCERGSYSSCKTGNNGTYASSTTAPIGLMYVSDYLYASGYLASNSTTQANSSYYGNKNWLYKGHEWTITPSSSTSVSAFLVLSGGSVVNHVDTYIGFGLRPTLYLKSDVYVTGGNGTFDNPYTIACDTCTS